MRQAMVVLALAAIACVLSGCITHSGGIAAATKPLNPDEITVRARASGVSWGVNVLGIPFKQASTADALNEAITTGGADALIQVSVDNRDYFLLLVNLQRIMVEGMSVKEPVRVKGQ